MTEGNRKAYCRIFPACGNFNRAPTRFVLFSATWFILTGPEAESWIFGLPAVICAMLLSLFLAPTHIFRISFWGICRFVPFFLRQSSLSGIDVLRRTLSPTMAIDPGLISYTTTLPAGAARVFFVNTISLLPGTLSADLRENTIIVHSLDRGQPVWANLQKLEVKIAVMFDLTGQEGEGA